MGLSDFPFACSPVEDEFLRGKGYRKLIIDSYIAFYIVNEEEKQVVVMRVLYGLPCVYTVHQMGYGSSKSHRPRYSFYSGAF
jgi:plasmid stabilization system protein ParE